MSSMSNFFKKTSSEPVKVTHFNNNSVNFNERKESKDIKDLKELKEKKTSSLFNGITSSSTLQAKIATLEQEKQMLKLTLDHMIKENNNLKNMLEDMKVTVNANKQQLKEYVDNITSKDKVVEKMNNTIEQLQQRLLTYETHHKKNIKDKLNTSINNINFNLNDSRFNPNSSTTDNIDQSTKIISEQFDLQKFKKVGQPAYHHSKKLNNQTQSLNTSLNISGNINTQPFSINPINPINPISQLNKTKIVSNMKKNITTTSGVSGSSAPVNLNLSIVSNLDKKDLLYNQQKIIEEIINIKHDLQFLLENSKISKAKVKSKINSLNSSYISNNSIIDLRGDKLINGGGAGNSSLNVSTNLNISRNDSVIFQGADSNNHSFINQSQQQKEIFSHIKSIYNLKHRTGSSRKLHVFSHFLSEYDQNKNILIMIDSSGCCWELVKRNDINQEKLIKGENLISILNKEYENFIFTDKLINIDLKEEDLSALDISKSNLF